MKQNKGRPTKPEEQKKKPVGIYVRTKDIKTLGGIANVRTIMSAAVVAKAGEIEHFENSHVGLGPNFVNNFDI